MRVSCARELGTSILVHNFQACLQGFRKHVQIQIHKYKQIRPEQCQCIESRDIRSIYRIESAVPQTTPWPWDRLRIVTALGSFSNTRGQSQGSF